MSELEVLKDFSALRGAFMVTSPFLGSLLTACEVKVTSRVSTAAVDDKKTIYINPDFYRRLPQSQRASVLAHEVLHLAFRHAARVKSVARASEDVELYNFAADAVVNHILAIHGYNLPRGAVTPSTIARMLRLSKEEVEKLSADELYRLLKDKLDDYGAAYLKREFSTSFGGEKGEGESEGGGYRGDLRPDLREGEQASAEAAGESGECAEAGRAEGAEIERGEGAGGVEGDWDEYWRGAVYRAFVVAKSVGRVPAGLERVFQLLKPKVDWRSLLRQSLITGMGSVAASTWVRVSRKHEELPGLRRYSINNVWMLIDMSGSISEDEASQFVSEVYAAAKAFKTAIMVVPWDTEVYEISTLRKPSDISRVKLRGGGGTQIKAALEEVYKRMRAHDAVVILTDGFIGDIDEGDVQRLMQVIAARASVSVFCTTAAEPKIPPKWRVIKIR